jgi:hypothetical protein
MNRPFAVSRALRLLVGSALCATSALAMDYSQLIDFPALSSKLNGFPITLEKAIEDSEKLTGAKATEAYLNYSAPTPFYAVRLFGTASSWAIQINAMSGEVMTKQETLKIPGEPIKGKVTKTASGLEYYDLVSGKGPKPAGPEAKVKVHYTGYFVDGSKFDSSVGGDPISFTLNEVIQGWIEGVGSMKVGGKRKLIIPHNLAYGPQGRPGIPPNAMLIFDIELIELPK